MITLRNLLPLVALTVAACVAAPPAAPPEATAVAQGGAEATRTRALRGDGSCPPEFSGTCYPVWFGTNRKPLDAKDLGKGFGGDIDERIHYGKRIVRIPATHRPGELGSPLWDCSATRTAPRLRAPRSSTARSPASRISRRRRNA